jgi:hypothetical protein
MILYINNITELFHKKYYLPKYVNLLRKSGEIIGFCINGYPSDKHKGGKYKKEFRFKTMKDIFSKEQRYKYCIQYLDDLINNKIVL